MRRLEAPLSWSSEYLEEPGATTCEYLEDPGGTTIVVMYVQLGSKHNAEYPKQASSASTLELPLKAGTSCLVTILVYYLNKL